MWLLITFFSMALYGIQEFLFKTAERNGCDEEITILTFFFTVGVLALLFSFLTGEATLNLNTVLFFGISQATFALFAFILRLEALKKIPSVSAFPLFGLSAFFSALLGITFLGETLSLIHALAIFLSVLAVLVLLKSNPLNFKKGMLIALGSASLMAIANILTKLASGEVEPFLFIGVSSLYGSIPLFALEKTRKNSVGCKETAVKIGILIAVVNLTAFYLLIHVLIIAKASVVYPIIGLSLVIAIFLSEIFYKEKLKLSTAIAAFLSLIAILLFGAIS